MIRPLPMILESTDSTTTRLGYPHPGAGKKHVCLGSAFQLRRRHTSTAQPRITCVLRMTWRKGASISPADSVACINRANVSSTGGLSGRSTVPVPRVERLECQVHQRRRREVRQNVIMRLPTLPAREKHPVPMRPLNSQVKFAQIAFAVLPDCLEKSTVGVAFVPSAVAVYRSNQASSGESILSHRQTCPTPANSHAVVEPGRL